MNPKLILRLMSALAILVIAGFTAAGCSSGDSGRAQTRHTVVCESDALKVAVDGMEDGTYCSFKSPTSGRYCYADYYYGTFCLDQPITGDKTVVCKSDALKVAVDDMEDGTYCSFDVPGQNVTCYADYYYATFCESGAARRDDEG